MHTYTKLFFKKESNNTITVSREDFEGKSKGLGTASMIFENKFITSKVIKHNNYNFQYSGLRDRRASNTKESLTLQLKGILQELPMDEVLNDLEHTGFHKTDYISLSDKNSALTAAILAPASQDDAPLTQPVITEKDEKFIIPHPADAILSPASEPKRRVTFNEDANQVHEFSTDEPTVKPDDTDEQNGKVQQPKDEVIELEPALPAKEEQSIIIPSMQILGGFIAALGVTAVAVSLSVFSLGLMPLTTALIFSGAGLATTLAGIGLFKSELTPNKPGIENDIALESCASRH